MNPIHRRSFLKCGLAGAGLLTGFSSRVGYVQAAECGATVDQVALGNTGIHLSRFAMGTGTRGWEQVSDQTKLGQQKFDALMRHGYDRGINFWDMADIYGSHPYAAKVLRSYPREKLVLLSKLWPEPLNWKPENDPKKDFDRIRLEIGTDYLDIVLLHGQNTPNWPEEKKAWMEVLSAEKEKGNIRALGCSCHSSEGLRAAAKSPWVEVVLAQINHKGGEEYRMGGPVEEVTGILKELRAAGKAILGMKLYGCGTLVEPDQREASLNYVLKNNLVDAATIGFLREAEIDEHIVRTGRILSS